MKIFDQYEKTCFVGQRWLHDAYDAQTLMFEKLVKKNSNKLKTQIKYLSFG
jgi:hypothetical protein